MIYQRVRGRIGGRVMSGLNGQHSGRAGQLSGVSAAIAGLTMNWSALSGALPPGATYTRAGNITYIDVAGVRQTAGANTMPLAYDPTTHALLGYQLECSAVTNHFQVSGAPATQTSGALGTGIYTLWMEGTGSIAVAGATATITGAGTATAGNPVTFTVTAGGTVTYTVTGSPTLAQAENSTKPTSYIAVPSTTPVARSPAVLSIPVAGILANAQGFAAIKGVYMAGQAAPQSYVSTFAGGGEGAPIYQDIVGMAVYDGAIRNWNATPYTSGPTGGQTFTIATTWAQALCNGSYNGTVGTDQTFDGSMNLATNMTIGGDPGGGQAFCMFLQGLRFGLQGVNKSRLANPFA